MKTKEARCPKRASLPASLDLPTHKSGPFRVSTLFQTKIWDSPSRGDASKNERSQSLKSSRVFVRKNNGRV